MKYKAVSSLLLLLLITSCSPISTKWHEEPVNDDTVTMQGSYKNAQESLVVKQHGWKVLTANKKSNTCEWGFRIDFECKDHPDYPDFSGTNGFKARPVIPIENIEYSLFDKDDFLLTTLTLSDENIAFRESQTFRHHTVEEIDLIKRAVKGRVNIRAGYNIKK